MNTTQETKWIRRIKRFGSSKDADALVRFYYDEIYFFVAKQVSDAETVYDLTQEIFISMLRSLPFYQEQKASFRTWLYRIATNKIIDFRRKVLPNTILLEELDEMGIGDYVSRIDYENNIVQAHFLEKIENYVSGFQADVQQIFRLHIYGEQTFGEIALLTEMPESSVKSKYYRLIKQIRREFYEEYTQIVGS
ncbi:MAG: RNA polymerase sigma factor [Candidatus Gastranaerophilales bacterium]|nr:RNA polymerase sigma factor [Candidatus Gastranaerophilales bacterium]